MARSLNPSPLKSPVVTAQPNRSFVSGVSGRPPAPCRKIVEGVVRAPQAMPGSRRDRAERRIQLLFIQLPRLSSARRRVAALSAQCTLWPPRGFWRLYFLVRPVHFTAFRPIFEALHRCRERPPSRG